MNRRQARGQFLRITGALREGWGRVINDQTMRIRGEQDRLFGRAQQRDGTLRVILFSRRLDRKSSARS